MSQAQLIAVDAARPAKEPIEQAARILKAGGLVAFPTETVYGLGGDAANDRTVARIFAAKGRPAFNPLIVHLHDPAQLEEIVQPDGRAEELAAAFWPGPLTLVLPRARNSPVSLLAGAGLPSLAVRIPSHPVALALLRAAGVPVAAPSANPSGRLSSTTPRHVTESLGNAVDMVLGAGRCPLGVESTVIGLTEKKATLLRPGGIAPEQIEAVIGPLARASAQNESNPKSPGQLQSHYAPRARLRLNAHDAEEGEAFLAFGPGPFPKADPFVNLSESGDLREAAANLFVLLHALDAAGARAIAVSPIPETGLGLAINDRLRRAAAPREK